MSLLKVTDLVVSYGGIEALKGISFEVDQGKIVTLIGANGAGKSTTLRTISGLVQPKDGRIYFEGRDITDYNTQKIVETGIFAGSVDVNTAAISSCIGWDATLPFAGAVKDGSAEVKDNYAGAEGTLSAKATEMGWSADIWDFSADMPKLK